MAYETQGVFFDGTNDISQLLADLTANADAKIGMFAGWFQRTGRFATLDYVYRSANSRVRILFNTSDEFRIEGRNSSGTKILELISSTTYTSDDGWHHFVAAWDLANTAGWLYIDDVDVDNGSGTFTDDTIDYTRLTHRIGADSGPDTEFQGNLADLYLNMAEFLDLDTAPNRLKFVTTAVELVDLGSDGSTPTGTAPIVYFRGPSANWMTNLGSGQNFTEVGTITHSAIDPPSVTDSNVGAAAYHYRQMMG